MKRVKICVGYKLVLLSVFLVLLFMVLHPTDAVYGSDNHSDVTYEVKAILDDEQKNMGIDYFYFLTQPNETKEFSVEIINYADTSETFEVQLNRAVTNKNGFLEYSESPEFKTNKEELDFHTLLIEQPKKILTIDGKQSKRVSFSLKMPNESFEGILLGGVYVSKSSNAEKSADNQTGASIQIKQKLSYGIAVMVQEKVPYTGGNQLLMHSIDIDLLDYQPVLVLNMENPKPNILNHVQMTTDIYKYGEEKPYITLKKDKMQFSPNNSFDLNIPLDKKELLEGKYKAVSTFYSGEERWEFEHTFTVTNKDVQKIEKNRVFTTSKQPKISIIIIILMVVTIFIVGFMMNRRR